ncbi:MULTISPECIES: hypothetical protein [Vibrio]|uniref:hypothetical protein n=1 Tax=Vibrio TaxID=662 RepID=UPI001E2AF1BF|nr:MULTISPECIES: hypothetical protein [Vibrio]MCR9352880.1 hypothetical protein [Vibrio alginolyticus]MCR9360683.1 hypothetical protein [Vibrio alginolyticus]MCR9382898.1 hypothetical protein [Vibrio alginolyticus]MCR9431900.1 hypothetical protein [Vibrio alginolyticus]MCR9435475.1 hypothetical protein [Vibrio alginolyticus]
MRTILIALLGLLFCLLAPSMSLAHSHPNFLSFHNQNIAVDAKSKHFSEHPIYPIQQDYPSLNSRNILRVIHAKEMSSNDDVEPEWFEMLDVAWWAHRSAIYSMKWLKRIGIETLGCCIESIFTHSKYRIGVRKESNFIYRFIHAR